MQNANHVVTSKVSRLKQYHQKCYKPTESLTIEDQNLELQKLIRMLRPGYKVLLDNLLVYHDKLLVYHAQDIT